jgi:TolA-binding protein
MRKFLLSAVILSSVATAAAPAAAQYNPQGRGYDYGYNHGRGIDQQLNNISQRIDRAFQRRLISSGEARRLQREVDQIARQRDRYARNGFTPWERQDIQNRIQNLRQQFRFERQEGRYDRWDDRRDDRYDDRRRWDDRRDWDDDDD